MKNKSKHTGVYIIAFILMIMAFILYTGTFNTSINLKSTKGIRKCKSINELIKTTAFELNIPDYVLKQSNENLNIESTMGQIIQINNDSFVFKAASFVNNNADPLGLYDKSNTDNMYKVDSDDIEFFRYRRGYKKYPNLTIINWCSASTAYGLMISDDISEEEALEMLGISNDNMTETSPAENDGILNKEEINNEYNTVVYNMNNLFNITLPDFKSSVDTIDGNGITSFYINKKLIFVILYNEYDIDSGTYDEHEEVIVDDNIVIRYLSYNPFEVNTEAYNDYNNFIDTIDNIKNSIEYQ